MGLVLELEKPFLSLSVHIDIDEDAAGVVLLALLEILELSDLAEISSSDGRKLHEAEALAFAAELLSDVILNQKAATEGPNKTLDFIPGSCFLGIVAGNGNYKKLDDNNIELPEGCKIDSKNDASKIKKSSVIFLKVDLWGYLVADFPFELITIFIKLSISSIFL